MKVTKLHLENFRIHKDSVLAFGESAFIVIRGRNFAGKSTVGQGLSMCLTPSTTGLDPQGRGFISKIKRGATKAVITAELKTKNHLLQRTVTLNTNASGRTQKTICPSDPTWRSTHFDSELERQRAAFTVVLNTDAFLAMGEKEQKNLLASLALPSSYEFDPHIVEGVERVLGEGVVNFASEPFAVINQAYKKLFDERQVVNRQVKEFLIPEELPIPTGVDSASLQEQLTAVCARRRELQQERDEAVAKANKEEQARVNAKAKLQAALDNEERRKNQIRDRRVKEGQLEYLRKVAAGKEELERLEAEHDQAEAVRETYVRQLFNLAKMPEDATACPTCEQEVSHEGLQALAAKLTAWIEEIDERLRQIDQKVEALGDVSKAIALIAAHDEAQRELDSFDEMAAERRKQIEEAQQDIPGPTLFDFAPYNQSLGECDAEIERLSGLLRPAVVAEERRKEVGIKRAQLVVLKERATVLDLLVKYFDKDGVKAKLLGQYIGGFENKLNEVLSAWGYSCALSIEPYQFDATTARGDVIPVRELSGAERIMFSMAFQCAVSRTSNIGIVVVDEVAAFLPEVRSVMNKRLYQMIKAGYLEQVILLVADTSEQIPDLPRAAFFMVDSGTVYQLSQIARKEVANDERRDQRSIASIA